MSLENPNFLKKKYDLHNSPDVESSTMRTEALSNEKIPQNPAIRIQNYLDRFKEITKRSDPHKRERGMEALKYVLHEKFVIDPDEISDSYFENQQRLARERGEGDIEITDEKREELSEVIVADQESTLDSWVDYLGSDDATYPDWLKYYAFRSVIGLSTFDKEKHEFGKRDKGTVAPFPDLNREALAYVLDAIEKKHEGKVPQMDALELEEQAKFTKLLQGENFGKLYAFAIEQITPASVDQLTITEGKWIKYNQNSNHMPLVESLQGHGTGWCTAGESTAQTQLKNGDFYVYYSHDLNGQPTVPRSAIRMQGNHIAEVRGIAQEQNLDPYIVDVVQDKLKEFGSEGEAYQKKSADMRRLTEISKKFVATADVESEIRQLEGKFRNEIRLEKNAKALGQTAHEIPLQAKKEFERLEKELEQKKELNRQLVLSQEELRFLYEIDEPIKGFGYQSDPRIEGLRRQRNLQEDIPIVLDCAPEEIARNAAEVNKNTKVYVGPLFPNMFTKIQHLEHLYTTFPAGKIHRASVEIGTIPKEDIINKLRQRTNNIITTIEAADIIKSPSFLTDNTPQRLNLVQLGLTDFDLPDHANREEVYDRAMTLGLDFCPDEVAPHLLLQGQIKRPEGSSLLLAMKPLTEADSIFKLTWFKEDEKWLDATSRISKASKFLFVVNSRKEA